MTANRYRWYIKWYVYLCFSGLPRKDTQERHALLDDENYYDVYISYGTDDDLWAQQITTKLENDNCNSYSELVNTAHLPEQAEQDFPQIQVINPTSPNLDHQSENTASEITEEERVQNSLTATQHADESKRSLITVYYEKRDAAANKSQIGQLANAIYRSHNVIVGLSVSYLEDHRRQFELDLIHTAMIERYGYSANSHIILVALQENGELMHKLPEQIRSHFINCSLTWRKQDEIQPNVFWAELIKRLRG